MDRFPVTIGGGRVIHRDIITCELWPDTARRGMDNNSEDVIKRSHNLSPDLVDIGNDPLLVDIKSRVSLHTAYGLSKIANKGFEEKKECDLTGFYPDEIINALWRKVVIT